MAIFIKTCLGVILNVDHIIMVHPRGQENTWMCVAVMQGQDVEEYVIIRNNLKTREEAVDCFDQIPCFSKKDIYS